MFRYKTIESNICISGILFKADKYYYNDIIITDSLIRSFIDNNNLIEEEISLSGELLKSNIEKVERKVKIIENKPVEVILENKDLEDLFKKDNNEILESTGLKKTKKKKEETVFIVEK